MRIAFLTSEFVSESQKLLTVAYQTTLLKAAIESNKPWT